MDSLNENGNRARSPSCRKIAGSYRTDATNPTTTLSHTDNFSRRKSPRSNKRTLKRSERHIEGSNGHARSDIKALQLHSGSSSSRRRRVSSPDARLILSESEQKLKILRQDFEGLRSLITCKICDRLLYEPFVISCGHTYCYSCLCTWFVNNKKNKTCPDCRIPVHHAPAPSYIIREMTQIFISRQDNLPTSDTLEQHLRWKVEEADLIQQDKNNSDAKSGGLFKGCFTKLNSGYPFRMIRDSEDGVDRCPQCGWEVEDGECVHCGMHFDAYGVAGWHDGIADDDFSSELDEDLELEDADLAHGFRAHSDVDGWDDYASTSTYEDNTDRHSNRNRRRRARQRTTSPPAVQPRAHSEGLSYTQTPAVHIDIVSNDEDGSNEDDEDDNEDSSMRDFIDDDSGGVREGTSSSSQSPPRRSQMGSAQRQRNIVRNARRGVAPMQPTSISSPITFLGSRPRASPRRGAPRYTIPLARRNEEDEDIDTGPVTHGRRRRQHHERDVPTVRSRARRARRHAIVSSNDEDRSTDASVEEGGREAFLFHDYEMTRGDERNMDTDDSDGSLW